MSTYLHAKAWISDDTEEGYWLEGEPVEVVVERTDDDEIRLGVHVKVDMSESAGIYLTDDEARSMVRLLEAALDDTKEEVLARLRTDATPA